jgi:hypothetical protein
MELAEVWIAKTINVDLRLKLGDHNTLIWSGS